MFRYKYDRRKNKEPYYLSYDGEKKILHQPDTLNIIGLLYIPDNHLIYGLSVNNEFMSMKEKTIIQQVFNVYSRKIHKITELPMLNRSLEYDIQLNQLDTLIHYNLSERLDKDVFYELIKQLLPTFTSGCIMAPAPNKQLLPIDPRTIEDGKIDEYCPILTL